MATKKKTTKKKTTAPILTGVDKWVAEINKHRSFAGHAQVRMASQVRTPYILRRPTGILGLDIGLGGGWHAGGAVEIRGEESVGKTLLAYKSAGELQKLYGDDTAIMIWGTEIRMDKSFARLAGFAVAYSSGEIEEFNRLRHRNGQEPLTKDEITDLEFQIGKVVDVAADTADVGFEILLKALEFGGFQMIIIESLGALITKLVDEGTVSDKHYGGPAGVVTTFQNKVNPLYMMDRPDGSMLETTLLGINQARANIGGGTYEPKTKGALGAWAWKHALLASVELTRGGQIRTSDKGPVVGRTVRWKTIKGKAGTHDGKKGSYDFYHFPKLEPVFWTDVQEKWLGGIDMYNEMAEMAKDFGLLGIAGSWVSWDGHKWQGMNNFAQFLAENAEAANAIKEQCIAESRILVRYD